MATQTSSAPTMNAPRPQFDESWGGELSATLRLAWPLIVAQLAQMALFTTDVIMMGWLGPKFLAAGTLAVAFMHPLLLFGVGVLSAVAPMVAQARGAGDAISLRRSVRQGFWVSIAITLLMLPVIWYVRPIFDLLGQPAELGALAESYARSAVWLFAPALGIIVMRGLVATHNDTSIILVVTLAGVVANAICNYALMFGHWGFPRLELMGSGISTALANLLMFLLLLAYTLTRPTYRAYALFTRFWKPDWSRFATIFKLGTPIGFMIMAEASLFAVAALFMGWLGTDELAAHAVALQLAAIAFMVPMGLGHAATVRVGLAYGRRSGEGVRKAGWVSIIIGTGFMALTCAAFWFAPRPLLGLFLDPAELQNAVPLALAVSYLGVAALFQLADGAQVVAGAVLRGLSDTAMPMVIAIVGYWGIGVPVAYLLGFTFGLRGVGVWIGLASGLVAVAVILAARFSLRERLGLV